MLAGWSRHPCVDGVIVRAPGGETSIRIRPRMVSPVAPRALVERTARTALGSDARIAHAPLARLITGEGEIAVLASAHVDAAAGATGLSVAQVGDEPCLCIEVIGADHREHASRLLRTLGLGLSSIRRRWFAYTPPAGWLGERRGRATVWLHPAYPRTDARITVFDARPHVDAASEQLHRFLFVRLPDGLRVLEPLVVEDVTSEHGLVGRVRRAVGTLDGTVRTVRAAAVHADDRFTYIANLDAPEDPAIEHTFRGVIASFAAVPHRPVEVEVSSF